MALVRYAVAAATGILVAAVGVWWLAQLASFGGSNGDGSSASELPAGWWVLFGGIALVAGAAAAWLVYAAFGGRRRD